MSTVCHLLARAPWKRGPYQLSWAFKDENLPAEPTHEELEQIRQKRRKRTRRKTDRQCTNQQTISLLSIAALRTKTGSAPTSRDNLVIVHHRVTHQDRQCTNQQTISLLSIAALRTKTGRAPPMQRRQSRYCPSPRCAPRPAELQPCSRQSRYCPSPHYAPRPAVHQPADYLVIVHRRVTHQDRQSSNHAADNLVIVHRRVTHQDRQCTNQQTISLLSIAALRTKTGSAPTSRQSRYCPSPRYAPRPAVHQPADNLVIVHRRVAHQDRQCTNQQTISLMSIATLRTKTGSAPTSRDNLVIVHRRVAHQDRQCTNQQTISLLSIAALRTKTGSAPTSRQSRYCPSPRCAPRPAVHQPADNLVIVHRRVAHQDRQCTNQQTISLLSITALRTKTGSAPTSSRQSRYCPSPRCAPRPAELHPCSADNLVIVHRHVAHQDRQSSNHAADNLVIVHRRVTHQDRQCTNQQTISLLSIAALRTKTGRAPTMQQTISLLSIAALRTKTGSAPTSRLSRYCPSPRYAPRPAVHQPADNLVIVHRRVAHQDRQSIAPPMQQQTISLLSIATLRTKTGRAPPMQQTISLLSIATLRTKTGRACSRQPLLSIAALRTKTGSASRYCHVAHQDRQSSPGSNNAADNLVIVHRRVAHQDRQSSNHAADNLVIVHRRVTHQDRQCTNQQTISLLSIAALRTKTGSCTNQQDRYCQTIAVIVHRHVAHQDRQCTNQQTISLLSIAALRTKTGRAPPMQRRQSRYCPSPRYAPRPAVHQGSRQSRYCPSPRCAPRPAELHPCSADNLVIVHRHVTHQDRQCTNQQTILLLSIAALRTKTGRTPPMQRRQSRYCPSPR
ncbi:hypothetical protein QZH41_000267 [Actinostola sp. cb2023]|nr:hypothetical protein QZH41_000267 [Actinostola sp. cb2023]